MADTLARTLLEVTGRNFCEIFRRAKRFDDLQECVEKRFEVATVEQRRGIRWDLKAVASRDSRVGFGRRRSFEVNVQLGFGQTPQPGMVAQWRLYERRYPSVW